ncbi:hypothetical protein WN944_027304 [Citrus x changshan-huyou]|uniref:Uncharacterized protein n=1 Tax=Citrus x changshan-huyou TaxID=2935761 RepID=A0AAP0LHC5_9ROSI
MAGGDEALWWLSALFSKNSNFGTRDRDLQNLTVSLAVSLFDLRSQTFSSSGARRWSLAVGLLSLVSHRGSALSLFCRLCSQTFSGSV